MAARKAAPKPPERKTETLSLRIDPKTRYGLEMLSRLQRRSATGVVEWTLTNAFASESLRDVEGHGSSLADAMDTLWQPDEPSRLLAMAFFYPALLTYEEERMFAVMTATLALWTNEHWKKGMKFQTFNFGGARKCWDRLKPLLQEAASKPTVQPLASTQLEAIDYEIDDLPF